LLAWEDIGAAAPGNMMTTDSNQVPGATVVKTWTAQQIFNGGLTAAGDISVTAGQFDSASQMGCSLYQTGVQAIPAGASTALAFNTEHFDRGPCHDNAVNNNRITIPSGGDGLWLFIGRAVFPNAAGNRGALISYQAVTTIVSRTEAASPFGVNTSYVIGIANVVAGDWFELQAFHSLGANTTAGIVDGCTFQAYKLC
jgi:hypothetical protein